MLAAVAGAMPRIPEGGPHPNGAICRTLVQLSAANVRFGSLSSFGRSSPMSVLPLSNRHSDLPGEGATIGMITTDQLIRKCVFPYQSDFRLKATLLRLIT